MILSLLCPALAWAEVTYSWVAADGETIYSPTPPLDPDQPYAMLENGVIVERFERSERLERPETEDLRKLEAERQQRTRDALLMVEFKSLEDIDVAMEEELGTLGYDFNLVDSTYDSLHQSLLDQIGMAADRQRAGLAVQQHDLDRIQSIRDRMTGNREDRQELETREAGIRDEYARKKERYRELLDAQAGP